MSDEQHGTHGQPDPDGGWQPMPQGREYDAEATAFVQLPPEPPSRIRAPRRWLGPAGAPGTGYNHR